MWSFENEITSTVANMSGRGNYTTTGYISNTVVFSIYTSYHGLLSLNALKYLYSYGVNEWRFEFNQSLYIIFSNTRIEITAGTV